jgi:hypothetical protein
MSCRVDGRRSGCALQRTLIRRTARRIRDTTSPLHPERRLRCIAVVGPDVRESGEALICGLARIVLSSSRTGHLQDGPRVRNRRERHEREWLDPTSRNRHRNRVGGCRDRGPTVSRWSVAVRPESSRGVPRSVSEDHVARPPRSKAPSMCPVIDVRPFLSGHQLRACARRIHEGGSPATGANWYRRTVSEEIRKCAIRPGGQHLVDPVGHQAPGRSRITRDGGVGRVECRTP